jgi:hypothetical protein
MNDDEDILEIMREAVARQRPWNNFFWWHDRSAAGKALAECSAVNELITSLKGVGLGSYTHARPSGENWPDCVTSDAEGRLVAVEVTELVDAAVLQRRAPPRPWTPKELRDALQARIDDKEAKAFHGGRYGQVLLLIHTDELFLTPSIAFPALREARFVTIHHNLDRVFLLLSYDPQLGCCPVVELKLIASAHG